MPHYIVQYRVIKLRSLDEEPDEWSSATSTMTLVEGSSPLMVEDDLAAIKRAPTTVWALASDIADQEG